MRYQRKGLKEGEVGMGGEGNFIVQIYGIIAKSFSI